MKLVSIVGARPQFIKLAPLIKAVQLHNQSGGEWVDHLIIHTGQHYDNGMSHIFFEELEIPVPDYNLSVGSGSHGFQTGRMLMELEKLLADLNPDAAIILGDTNSTLAGALAASKLHIPLAHVEAGLRSFNRNMPEELNRIIADHTSDLLLAPTENAMKNLEKEGLAERSIFTGDIMLDAVRMNIELAEKKSHILKNLRAESHNYALATVHRAENTDSIENMKNILDAFNIIASDYYPLIFPMHPRTNKYINEKYPGWEPVSSLQIIPPVGYLDMLMLSKNASIILTDSGGLQKEAFFLDTPCITLRSETEWVETIWAEANIIAGTDRNIIINEVSGKKRKTGALECDFSCQVRKYFGSGNAAERILAAAIDAAKKYDSKVLVK